MSAPAYTTHSLPIALFHRSFLSYTGGHGKVWDYYNHVKASGLYQTQIYFTPDSIFDASNPWLQEQEFITKDWHPESADLLFLAGTDWGNMPTDIPSHIPIVNLIQGLRHADPKTPHFQYLTNKAIRICVSQPVANAIHRTGRVNGPILVIPNGLDIPEVIAKRQVSQKIFIGALKNKDIGTDLDYKLKALGYEVELLTEKVLKNEYLSRLAQARIAILLPLQEEGFYLPGLEAMAIGTPIIMTDCGGNREYARDRENCIMTDPEHIISAVQELDSKISADQLRQAGLRTASTYTLTRERELFLQVLHQAETIWSTIVNS
jgi:glycosyltransferase involved in cell wall biosynthesis